MEVRGRVLPPPKLQYGGRVSSISGQVSLLFWETHSDGSENMHIYDLHLSTLLSWFSSKLRFFIFTRFESSKLILIRQRDGEEYFTKNVDGTSLSRRTSSFYWERIIKPARKGCNVFTEQGQLGIAESRRLGHAGKTILHRSGDPRLGHRLLCTTAHSARRCSQKLHPTASKDFKWRWYANNWTAVLLQIRNRTRSSWADVPLSQKLVQPVAARCRRFAWEDSSLWWVRLKNFQKQFTDNQFKF